MNKTYALTYTLLIFISVAIFTGSATITMAENVMISSDIRGFSKVQLNTSSDVKISMGKDFSVVMTGDEEKIGDTMLVLKRDTLIIKHKKENQNHNYDRDQEMLIPIVIPNI